MPNYCILSLRKYLPLMDIKTYPVDIDILLTPVGEPLCKITVGDQQRDIKILQQCHIKLKVQGLGPLQLAIEHHSKRDLDPTTALIIEEIKFDTITSPRFVWEGIYRPNYPKHMTGASELKYHNYLGWNGVWSLDFTLPIYTWIHKIEDLGWIYD